MGRDKRVVELKGEVTELKKKLEEACTEKHET